jgi:hypothetical protein
MIEAPLSPSSPRRSEPYAQLRIWHLALLVLYVAIAIVDIQAQRLAEPNLIGLAAAGFAGYGFLVWLIWRMIRRFEARVGMIRLVIVYLIAMAALFLFANVVYLVIEHAYHSGIVRTSLRGTLR